MNKPIVLPVILASCIPKTDKSASIRFVTALELTAEQNAAFFENMGLHGALYFRAGETQQEDLDAMDEVELDLTDKAKTPSKRLRAVIWVLWKQENPNAKKSDFNNFYKDKIEGFIERIKQDLE